MVYVPTAGKARTIKVNLTKISGSQAKAWWFNPSTGRSNFGRYAQYQPEQRYL